MSPNSFIRGGSCSGAFRPNKQIPDFVAIIFLQRVACSWHATCLGPIITVAPKIYYSSQHKPHRSWDKPVLDAGSSSVCATSLTTSICLFQLFQSLHSQVQSFACASWHLQASTSKNVLISQLTSRSPQQWNNCHVLVCEWIWLLRAQHHTVL